jgi:hypothetical protein
MIAFFKCIYSEYSGIINIFIGAFIVFRFNAILEKGRVRRDERKILTQLASKIVILFYRLVEKSIDVGIASYDYHYYQFTKDKFGLKNEFEFELFYKSEDQWEKLTDEYKELQLSIFEKLTEFSFYMRYNAYVSEKKNYFYLLRAIAEYDVDKYKFLLDIEIMDLSKYNRPTKADMEQLIEKHLADEILSPLSKLLNKHIKDRAPRYNFFSRWWNRVRSRKEQFDYIAELIFKHNFSRPKD